MRFEWGGRVALPVLRHKSLKSYFSTFLIIRNTSDKTMQTCWNLCNKYFAFEEGVVAPTTHFRQCLFRNEHFASLALGKLPERFLRLVEFLRDITA